MSRRAPPVGFDGGARLPPPSRADQLRRRLDELIRLRVRVESAQGPEEELRAIGEQIEAVEAELRQEDLRKHGVQVERPGKRAVAAREPEQTDAVRDSKRGYWRKEISETEANKVVEIHLRNGELTAPR